VGDLGVVGLAFGQGLALDRDRPGPEPLLGEDTLAGTSSPATACPPLASRMSRLAGILAPDDSA
jgi:hypothetical protein